MICEVKSRLSLLVILVSLTSSVHCIRVNITKFASCDLDPRENLEHFIMLDKVSYERDADGYCDTVHGQVTIPTIITTDKLINITMFRCRADTVGACNENAESFKERLHCERFRKDESGPWFMISDALSSGHCGEEKGVFDLKRAKLKPEYLTNYMIHDHEFTRHRMIHMMHKSLNPDSDDDLVMRACLDMEFTIVF